MIFVIRHGLSYTWENTFAENVEYIAGVIGKSAKPAITFCKAAPDMAEIKFAVIETNGNSRIKYLYDLRSKIIACNHELWHRGKRSIIRSNAHNGIGTMLLSPGSQVSILIQVHGCPV